MATDSVATPGILEGVRVIDMTHIVAGPHATRLLAGMGAEVIKIEPVVSGEFTRGLPHWKNGVSGFFLHMNSGKKGISVDLKQPEGLAILKDLVAVSDVIVQNHKSGFYDRLGLPYEKLAEINPRLIVCSISAFGDTGPYSSMAGGDYTIQAMGGALAITGKKDGVPQFCWVPWTDCATGTTATAAICAALFHREKTGKGQYIDMGMLDTVLDWHDFAIQEYVLSDGKVERKRSGPYHSTLAPFGAWECQDGHVVFNVVHQYGWAQLCEVMGRSELATDARYDSLEHRVERHEEVNQIVADWLKHFTVEEAKMLLEQAGVFCPPVLEIGEIVDDPHVRAREMLVEMDHPLVGRHLVPNSPFKFSDTPARVQGRAPLLGEHNREVLAKILGYDQERIENLKTDGVIYEEEAVAGLFTSGGQV